MPYTDGACRNSRRRVRVALLVFKRGKAAVGSLVGSTRCNSASGHGESQHKAAPGSVRRSLCRAAAPPRIRYGALGAIADTVHAHHAARVVNRVVLGIYAGSLALAATRAATVAFIRVYHRLQQGKTAQQAEHRSCGTHLVAIVAPAAPCHSRDHDEGKHSHSQHSHIQGLRGRIGVKHIHTALRRHVGHRNHGRAP